MHAKRKKYKKVNDNNHQTFFKLEAFLKIKKPVQRRDPAPSSGYHVATLSSFLCLMPQPFVVPQLCQKCFPSIIWQSHLVFHQVSMSAPHKRFSSLSSYLKYYLWFFSKFSMFPFLHLLKSVTNLFTYLFFCLSPWKLTAPG